MKFQLAFVTNKKNCMQEIISVPTRYVDLMFRVLQSSRFKMTVLVVHMYAYVIFVKYCRPTKYS